MGKPGRVHGADAVRTLLFTLGLACVLVSGEALAQVETLTPFSGEGIKALLPFLVVAAMGGFVSFYQKVKAGEARPFNIVELIGELATSGFAGMLAYWLCQYAGINQWLMAAVVGMAGHGGSRALFVMEKWAERKLDAATPGLPDKPEGQ